MIGPLPPSLVRWVTISILVLRPAAPAMRSAKLVMVGRRVYSCAFSRWSTTWIISSTKPSRPTKAEKVPALVMSEVSWRAHCSRRFEAFIGLIHFYADDLEHAVQIVVIEEADFHRAFSFAIAEQNFRAETFLKFGLKFADVNVGREGRFRGQAGIGRGST